MTSSFVLKRYAAVAIATMAIACGSKGSGTQPTPTPTVTNVSVNPTSVVGGNTVQGTVTLSTAPTSTAVVTLASNNGAAAVPSTITVTSGSATGTFNVTT